MLNKVVTAVLPLIPKKIVEIVSKPYIAGENIFEAIKTVGKLNSLGALATIDVLGEDVFNADESRTATKKSLEVLDFIASEKVNSNLSLKLSHLGLKINYSLCKENFNSILSSAKEKNIFVRIDMEDHTTTDNTIKLFRDSRNFYDNIGVVIQAYLKRSESDINYLVKENANIRLCKGIYNEPHEIAFKKRDEIQNNFLHLLEIIFKNNCYCGIATHDDVLINGAKKIISELKIDKNKYEFQMLLGVRENLRNKIISDGYKLRIYTPFGKDWYAYSIRRLKENPQMALYITKAIFTKR